MANQYVTITHDGFTNAYVTKSYALSYKLAPRRSTLTEMVEFTIRHVNIGTANGLYIDMMFTSGETDVQHMNLDVAKSGTSTLSGDWDFFQEGEFIIKTDDETIRLTPIADDSDVARNGISDAVVVTEKCSYKISQEILHKICEGRNVRMQLSGGRGNWVLEGADFVLMAKAFYNGFYDNSKYNNELQHPSDVTAKKNSIKKRGCLIEIIIAVIFYIWADYHYQDKWDDDVSRTIGAILLLSIVAVAIVRRVMAKKVR